ncbi:MAG: hypothetical protein Q8743_02440, partial [Candidatus Phytoplasma australasiaticum]|nr:hypothetical protein [Candidatus Phytoplasma australasiaticum]
SLFKVVINKGGCFFLNWLDIFCLFTPPYKISGINVFIFLRGGGVLYPILISHIYSTCML